MQVRIGIVISNASVTTGTHSTVHIAQAALEAGHGVYFIEPWDFEVDPDGILRARAHVANAPLGSRDALVQALGARQLLRRSIEIGLLDVLLLRMNPLHEAVLSFALLAQAAGVRVLNNPLTLYRTNHKAWLATLSGVPRPETLVTRSRAAAERFCSACPAVVVKPARACGGRAVALVRGLRGLEDAFEDAQKAGDGYVIVQAYLPEASQGEKRLLWLEGQVIGGYLRQRAPGEFRHNLKTGGSPQPLQITDQERNLMATLSPHLHREGIWFAGVDVIGNAVVEVNVLNPGGLHYSGQFSGDNLGAQLVSSLQRYPSSQPLVADPT